MRVASLGCAFGLGRRLRELDLGSGPGARNTSKPETALNTFSKPGLENCTLGPWKPNCNICRPIFIWFPGLQFSRLGKRIQSCFSFADALGPNLRTQIELPKPPTKPKCILQGLLNAFGRVSPNPKLNAVLHPKIAPKMLSFGSMLQMALRM